MAEEADAETWNDRGDAGATSDGYSIVLALGAISRRVIVTIIPPGGGASMVGGCADIPAAQEFAREMIAEHRARNGAAHG